jgi:regulator of RNase E activity RraB
MNDDDQQAQQILKARVETLEENLDLSLKTISVLTLQCKHAATLIESLSANQLNQQAQIIGIAEAVDGIASALGMYYNEENEEEDDTWH